MLDTGRPGGYPDVLFRQKKKNDYASFLMDSAHQYVLSSLDRIHNRCIRIIEHKKKGDREKNIENLMNTLNQIQNIRQRRKVQLFSFMFTESKVS